MTLNELIARGEIIRPDELARGLKVSQGKVYAWCERGTIDFLRIGKSIRFEPENIKEWLKAKRQVARKAPGGGPTT